MNLPCDRANFETRFSGLALAWISFGPLMSAVDWILSVVEIAARGTERPPTR